jgi:hypothetical protein
MNKCEHPRSEIRRRVQSNGVVAYWRQCLDCFQIVGTAVKHCDAPGDALPFDELARTRYWDEQVQADRSDWEQRQQQRCREAQQRDREWWDRYNDYLEGDGWQRKRDLVFARDAKRCQARLDGCSIFATQVHHLTYRHVFNEPLFDLVAVCQSCHEQLHHDE